MGISAKGELTSQILGYIATQALYMRYCNITTDQMVGGSGALDCDQGF
jgi:hypothetical protein